MKYIKTFENNESIEYSVGDTVICIRESETIFQSGIEIKLKSNEIYLILRIYDILERDYNKYKGERSIFVDVQNIKTEQESVGWKANRFRKATKEDVDQIKYNL